MDKNLEKIYNNVNWFYLSNKELINKNLLLSKIINNKFILIYKKLNEMCIYDYNTIKKIMDYYVKINIKLPKIYKYYECYDIDYYKFKNGKRFINFIYNNILPFRLFDNDIYINNYMKEIKKVIHLNISNDIINDVENDLHINKEYLKNEYPYRFAKLHIIFRLYNGSIIKTYKISIFSNKNLRLLDEFSIE